MSKRTRRIISIAFIAAFLIAAPLLLFYSLGYRYSAKKKIIQPTGALSIVTVPKDATVIINSVAQKEKTPFRLTQLHPGNYTVEITKQGYTSWQRRVDIAAGAHTLISPVHLFPYRTLTPSKVMGKSDELLWYDTSSAWMIIKKLNDDGMLSAQHLIFDTRTDIPLQGALKVAAAGPSDLSLALLHDNGRRLTLVFFGLASTPSLRNIVFAEEMQGLSWLDERNIVLWNDRGLAVYSVTGTLLAKLPRARLIDARASHRTIAWLERSNSESLHLYTSDIRLTNPRLIATLALPEETILIENSPDGLFTLWDTRNDTVILLPAQNGEPHSFSLPSLQAIQWVENKNYLLLVSRYEISVIEWRPFMPNPPKQLTRISEELRSFYFNPSYDTVFYTTPSRLAFISAQPQIDREPHTLLNKPDLFILGSAAPRDTLFVLQNNALFTLSLTNASL